MCAHLDQVAASTAQHGRVVFLLPTHLHLQPSPPTPLPISSSLLSSYPKLSHFIQQRDALLSSSSFYELLQLYKSHIHRHHTRKDPHTAAVLALDGASTLLSHGQGNAGGELALSLVDAYTRQQLLPSPPLLSTLLGLFWAFPADARTSRLSFMKAAVRWSVGPTHKHGHPDLHLSFARFYALPPVSSSGGEKEYASSHLHYLLSASASTSLALTHGAHVPPTLTPPPPPPPPHPPTEWDTYAEHASLLLEWASHGLPSELPLFITRAVLQYLALGDLRGGHAVLDGFMGRLGGGKATEVGGQPLLHFVQFVMRLCERGEGGGELLDVLRAKYAPELGRDEGLDALLDKVGQVFFGREAKKSWLDNLLG